MWIARGEQDKRLGGIGVVLAAKDVLSRTDFWFVRKLAELKSDE
jgi:hypothetical protein